MQTLRERAAIKVVFVQSAKCKIRSAKCPTCIHFALRIFHFAFCTDLDILTPLQVVQRLRHRACPGGCGNAARPLTGNFVSPQPKVSACESDEQPQRAARNPRPSQPNPVVGETDFRAVRVSRSISFNGRVSGRGPEPSLLLRTSCC